MKTSSDSCLDSIPPKSTHHGVYGSPNSSAPNRRRKAYAVDDDSKTNATPTTIPYRKRLHRHTKDSKSPSRPPLPQCRENQSDTGLSLFARRRLFSDRSCRSCLSWKKNISFTLLWRVISMRSGRSSAFGPLKKNEEKKQKRRCSAARRPRSRGRPAAPCPNAL